MLVTACASQPEELQASHTSDLRFQDWSCKQLAMEAETIDRKISMLYGQLKKKAGDDQAQMAVGLILFWPALFFLEGGDGPQAAEYTRLKGDREAIDRVARFKDCSIIVPIKEPSSKQEQVLNQLKELKKLKEQGEIGDTEYEEKKAALVKTL